MLPPLERLGLRDHFTSVVTADAAVRGKPAPDTYLEACARLGVDPRDGGRRRGLAQRDRGGEGGRLACVTVPHALTETLDLSAADLRLRSLADCTLAEATRQLGHG